MTLGKIRAAILAAKSESIQQMLEGMASLPLDSLDTFLADPRMIAAGESYLRRALEALLDIGRHLLAKGFGTPATEYKEIPRRLGDVGILDGSLTERLIRMAGYRNRLVHFYDEITPEELYRILTQHRGDIAVVLEALRDWVAAHPERVDTSL